jgi:hypothetical protein
MEGAMFQHVMAAAIAIGAAGGASIAVAEHALAPAVRDLAGAPPTHRAQEGAPCAPQTIRIYFAPGETRLNEDAHDLVHAAARQAAGCGALDITVAVPREEASRDLRRAARRSAAVVTALRARGLSGEVSVGEPADDPAFGIRRASPAFVQVAVTPSDARLVSEAARPTRF